MVPIPKYYPEMLLAYVANKYNVVNAPYLKANVEVFAASIFQLNRHDEAGRTTQIDGATIHHRIEKLKAITGSGGGDNASNTSGKSNTGAVHDFPYVKVKCENQA